MIIHHSELPQIRDKHKDEVISYTGGVFDLLNQGHVGLFNHLRELGDITVVGVTPNSRATYRKGPTRPVNDEIARLAIVDAMRDIDYCFISPDQPDPNDEYVGYGVLRDLRPDYFATSNEAWQEDAGWLRGQGTELRIVPRFDPTVSTTDTINRVLSLHGYPPVVGKQRSI